MGRWCHTYGTTVVAIWHYRMALIKTERCVVQRKAFYKKAWAGRPENILPTSYQSTINSNIFSKDAAAQIYPHPSPLQTDRGGIFVTNEYPTRWIPSESNKEYTRRSVNSPPGANGTCSRAGVLSSKSGCSTNKQTPLRLKSSTLTVPHFSPTRTIPTAGAPSIRILSSRRPLPLEAP
jgi:hypothetical protein